MKSYLLQFQNVFSQENFINFFLLVYTLTIGVKKNPSSSSRLLDAGGFNKYVGIGIPSINSFFVKIALSPFGSCSGSIVLTATIRYCLSFLIFMKQNNRKSARIKRKIQL